LKARADPTAVAHEGLTAAVVAGKRGHTALQSLLLRAADDYRKAHPVAASAVKYGAVIAATLAQLILLAAVVHEQYHHQQQQQQQQQLLSVVEKSLLVAAVS
jgi:hypothetical protein